MIKSNFLPKNVKVFHLTKDSEKEEYEKILNNNDLRVYKEVISNDRSGNPIVTIWYEEETD